MYPTERRHPLGLRFSSTASLSSPPTPSYAMSTFNSIPANSHIWVSCTDHHFSFKESHVASPGIVIKVDGNKVTDAVITQIKQAELDAKKEFHISVLGHCCCLDITGGCYCQPGETPSSELVRQNLKVQMDELIRKLRPKFAIWQVPIKGGYVLPEQFKSGPSGPHLATDGDCDQGVLWGWVLEADGMFHLVYIAGPSYPVPWIVYYHLYMSTKVLLQVVETFVDVIGIWWNGGVRVLREIKKTA